MRYMSLFKSRSYIDALNMTSGLEQVTKSSVRDIIKNNWEIYYGENCGMMRTHFRKLRKGNSNLIEKTIYVFRYMWFRH